MVVGGDRAFVDARGVGADEMFGTTGVSDSVESSGGD
jgi:hypothetical protein